MSPPQTVRTAEIVGALSLATDLGMRAPFEHALRSTWYAVRLAERMGLDDEQRRCAYYVTQLLYVGCTADVDVVADTFGDEEEFRLRVAPIAYGNPSAMMRTMLSMAGSPATGPRRVLAAAQALAEVPRRMPTLMQAHCEVATLHAQRLRLPPDFDVAFAAIYERWDGKGGPHRLAGEAIPLPVRIAQLAHDLDVQRGLHDVAGAEQIIAARSGRAFDPAVVDAARGLEPAPDADTCWDRALACEPEPHLTLSDGEIDDGLECLGTFSEMISPCFRGHARAVADLASAAGVRLGLGADELTRLRRAALVQDVGRVWVPSRFWNSAGRPGADGWERIRLHAYQSERVLAGAPWLAELGALAGAHHERCDGSGYHRRSAGAAVPLPARILSVADAYCALTAQRPQRPACSPLEAAAQLRSEAAGGRLDPTVTQAVLDVAGLPSPRTGTAGNVLTPRELQVLRLLSRGRATKQIASELDMSAKTADNHIQRIYAKAGVSTRAAAALWAVQRGLVS